MLKMRKENIGKLCRQLELQLNLADPHLRDLTVLDTTGQTYV